MHDGACMWRGGDTLKVYSVLSFHHVGLGSWSQVIRTGTHVPAPGPLTLPFQSSSRSLGPIFPWWAPIAVDVGIQFHWCLECTTCIPCFLHVSLNPGAQSCCLYLPVRNCYSVPGLLTAPRPKTESCFLSLDMFPASLLQFPLQLRSWPQWAERVWGAARPSFLSVSQSIWGAHSGSFSLPGPARSPSSLLLPILKLMQLHNFLPSLSFFASLPSMYTLALSDSWPLSLNCWCID